MRTSVINKWYCFRFQVDLRTVPTVAPVHKFCAPRDGPRKSGFITVVPAKREIFLRGL